MSLNADAQPIPSEGRQTELIGSDADRRLRNALDDLDTSQAECERLLDENERLRSEMGSNQELRARLAAAEEAIRVMEGTRGWRLLVWYRRVRDRLLARS